MGIVAAVFAAPDVRGQEAPTATSGAWSRSVSLSGYAQFDYRRSVGSAAPTSVRHELHPRRVRLDVRGDAAERLSYRVSFQGDGAQASSASVIDVYATFGLATWARIRVGQFKYDFDLQGRQVPSAYRLADQPFVTNVVAGGLDGASTPSKGSGSFRDRGVAVFGSTQGDTALGYSLGVYQGAGRASDNNSSLAFVGRLQASHGDRLLVSGGFLSNDTADPMAPEEGRYQAWVVGVSVTGRKAIGRAEYYHADLARVPDEAEASGLYVFGSVEVEPRLELMARYQRLRDDRVSSRWLDSLDLGAKWYLNRIGISGGSSVAANLYLRGASGERLAGVTSLNDGRGVAVASPAALGTVLVVRLQVQF